MITGHMPVPGLVWFALVDYDEASLPYADGMPAYAAGPRTVSFDEEAGPRVGRFRVPPVSFVKDGCALALVEVRETAAAHLKMDDDGCVSITRVDRAVRR